MTKLRLHIAAAGGRTFVLIACSTFAFDLLAVATMLYIPEKFDLAWVGAVNIFNPLLWIYRNSKFERIKIGPVEAETGSASEERVFLAGHDADDTLERAGLDADSWTVEDTPTFLETTNEE